MLTVCSGRRACGRPPQRTGMATHTASGVTQYCYMDGVLTDYRSSDATSVLSKPPGKAHTQLSMHRLALTRRRIPPNLKFEVDDVEQEWAYPFKIDFIVNRYMTGSIGDWPQLVGRIYEYVVAEQ